MLVDSDNLCYNFVSSKTYRNANGLAVNKSGSLTVTMEEATVTANDILPYHDSDSQEPPIPDWYTLKPHEFIQVLFAEIPSGFVEVCYLAPENAHLYPHTVVQWASLPLADLDPTLPNIMGMNARGYNCYIAPAVRGRRYDTETRISEKNGKPYTFYPRGKALDAVWISALWVDVDVADEAGYRQLTENIVPPSIILYTGGGWHGYWLLTEPLAISDDNRDMVKRTLKGMAIACGGDTKVADFARIMRLPGTVNTKPNRGQTCMVHDFIPCRYHYNELEIGYAPLAAPAIPQVSRELPIEASAGMPPWVEKYLNSGAVQGERNNTAYAAARALLDNGFSSADTERYITSRAIADGLTDQEIATLLNSAHNATRSAPNLPTHMMYRMAAADKRLGRKKGQ